MIRTSGSAFWPLFFLVLMRSARSESRPPRIDPAIPPIPRARRTTPIKIGEKLYGAAENVLEAVYESEYIDAKASWDQDSC